MVRASKILKNYIDSQEDLDVLAERAGVSKSVLYSLINDKSPSSETVAKMLEVTGFDYEKAFETEK